MKKRVSQKPNSQFLIKENRIDELKDLNVRKTSVVKNIETQTEMKMETINRFEMNEKSQMGKTDLTAANNSSSY